MPGWQIGIAPGAINDCVDGIVLIQGYFSVLVGSFYSFFFVLACNNLIVQFNMVLYTII